MRSRSRSRGRRSSSSDRRPAREAKRSRDRNDNVDQFGRSRGSRRSHDRGEDSGRGRREADRSPRRRESERSRRSSDRPARRSIDRNRDRSPRSTKPPAHDGRSSGGMSKYGSSLSSRPSASYGGSMDSDYYQARIDERRAKVFSIWSTFPSPPSPKAKAKEPEKPARRSPSPAPSSSSSESSDDEDDRRRRRSKKASSRKTKTKKKKSSSKHKKSSKSSSKKRRRSPSPSSSSSSDSSSSDESDVHTNKLSSSPLTAADALEASQFRDAVQGHHAAMLEDEPDVIGPMPMPDSESSGKGGGSYGRDLLPGEGAAIAQYVQKNMRIPRRGEVGWSGNEIESLETAGYVMSGSRHQRMNAVRIRKENQVYSAEEKRALALINFEEKQQRENNVMAEFRTMLTEKLTKKHGALVVEERQDDVVLDKE